MKLEDRIKRCIEDQFLLAGIWKDPEINRHLLNDVFLESLLKNFYDQEVKKKPRKQFLKYLDKKLNKALKKHYLK